MQKNNITAFLIISILGTLGHFVYDWSGKLYTLGLFFPIKESTWEHLKLLFFPSVIFFTIRYFLLDIKPENFIFSVTASIFIGMASIVVLFYTYKGVVGKNIDFLNIFIYYVGVITTIISQNAISKDRALSSNFFKIISITAIILTVIMFAGFSYNPPDLGIFKDPLQTS